MEDPATFTFIIVFIVVSVFITIFLVLRCLLQGKKCPSRFRLDGKVIKTICYYQMMSSSVFSKKGIQIEVYKLSFLFKVVLITGADNKEGIELVKELVKRGAERIIMAVANLDLGQDVALEVRAELNGNVVAEYCDMSSITSIREFCTKMLETESRLHILINHHTVMWEPLKRTKEGHEWHWGCNHLAHFVVTQLLMPLLLRGTPDARVITLSSSWYTRGKILWDNPDYLENPHYPHRDSSVNAERNSSVPIASPENSSSSKSKEHASFQIESGSDQKRVNRRRYNATEAFNQSKLANILFSRQLSERMEGTGVNT